MAVDNIYLKDQAGLTAAAEERSRIARELHDSVTQALYSMTLLADATILALTSGKLEAVAERLARIKDVARRHAGGRNGIDYRARRYQYTRAGSTSEARGPDIQQALWFEEDAPAAGSSVVVAVCSDDPARATAEADIAAVNDRVVPPLFGALLVVAALVNATRPRAAPRPSGRR